MAVLHRYNISFTFITTTCISSVYGCKKLLAVWQPENAPSEDNVSFKNYWPLLNAINLFWLQGLILVPLLNSICSFVDHMEHLYGHADKESGTWCKVPLTIEYHICWKRFHSSGGEYFVLWIIDGGPKQNEFPAKRLMKPAIPIIYWWQLFPIIFSDEQG